MSILKQKRSIGLDISDHSFKACSLSKRRQGIFCDKFRTLRVPDGVLENGRFLKPKKAVKLLTKVLQAVKVGHDPNFVNAVLPDTATFVKLIKVSQETEESLGFKEALEKEVVQHIPFKLKDVYFDYQEINGNFANNNDKEVLVGVCPKEIVEEYTEIIKKTNFTPTALEIESLAITRSIFLLEKRDQNKKSLSNRNIIVLDLGEARSSLIFWREQKYNNIDTIEFSVSLPLSGSGINNKIEKKLKLNPEQAEYFKIKCGFKDIKACHGGLQKILKGVLLEFKKRIKQSIEFHRTYFQQASIDKILLCGGGGNLIGFAEYLSKEVGIPVEKADPLINIQNKKVMPKADSLPYASAIGLALKDLCV